VQPVASGISRQTALVDVDLRVIIVFDTAFEKGNKGRYGQALIKMLHIEPGT
jgi:hypothetical protein